MAFGIRDWYRRRRLAVSSLVRLLRQLIPFALSRLLPLLCRVLHFGIVVRAFIKELGIDLHEELHGIVYHAMNRPTTMSHRPFDPWRPPTYLFQWPFEFSYSGANMIGNMTSTLSLMRLQKYSLFQK